MIDKPLDNDSRVEQSRERRRRINQAFREGDLKVCLTEIQVELEETSGESDLLNALPKVQIRYLAEVVNPLVQEQKWNEAEQELDFVQSVGTPDEEVTSAIDTLRGQIRSLRTENISSPPQEHEPEKTDHPNSDSEISEDLEEKVWREAHAVLRQGEQAWAEGKKRHARNLMKKLDSYSIDDHDFLLRKDGLMKLLDESESHISRPARREASAVRWVLVLAMILASALIAVLLLDHFSDSQDMQIEHDADLPQITDSVRTEPDLGYIRISGIDTAAIVLDEDGGVIGRAARVLPIPSGNHAIRVRSDGYRDSLISLRIARAETIDISVNLRPSPPPRGWIQFRSRPSGASIVGESGTIIGTTPLDSVIFEPGRYSFTMKKQGYVPTSVRADVTEAALITVTGELPIWHETGRFQLNSRPWAYVFVNGDSLGPTPLTTPDMPTAIPHTFMFRTSDGRELTKRLRLDPARSSPTPVTVDFPAPGIIAVATIDSVTGVPMWATISADSRVLGESPAEFSLSSGITTIRAEREGYQAVERTIEIKPGQRVTLTLALPPYRS